MVEYWRRAMKLRFCAASTLLLRGSVAHAQDALPVAGKWFGNYVVGAYHTTLRIALDIKSVDGDKIKGVGSVHISGETGGGCWGNFPIEGTFNENLLRVRATSKFGGAGDC